MAAVSYVDPPRPAHLVPQMIYMPPQLTEHRWASVKQSVEEILKNVSGITSNYSSTAYYAIYNSVVTLLRQLDELDPNEATIGGVRGLQPAQLPTAVEYPSNWELCHLPPAVAPQPQHAPAPPQMYAPVQAPPQQQQQPAPGSHHYLAPYMQHHAHAAHQAHPAPQHQHQHPHHQQHHQQQLLQQQVQQHAMQLYLSGAAPHPPPPPPAEYAHMFLGTPASFDPQPMYHPHQLQQQQQHQAAMDFAHGPQPAPLFAHAEYALPEAQPQRPAPAAQPAAGNNGSMFGSFSLPDREEPVRKRRPAAQAAPAPAAATSSEAETSSNPNTPSPPTVAKAKKHKEEGADGKKKKSKPKTKPRPQPMDRGLVCHSCGTSTTPEWRRGPEGIHTLCNACGLRYNKRQRKAKAGEAPPLVAPDSMIPYANMDLPRTPPRSPTPPPAHAHASAPPGPPRPPQMQPPFHLSPQHGPVPVEMLSHGGLLLNPGGLED